MPGITGKQAFMRALPPLALIVGGSYLLSVFMQGKYDAQDRGSGLTKKVDNGGTKHAKKEKFDLEKEYEVNSEFEDSRLKKNVQKMQQNLELDNYVNKRVPR